MRTSNFQSKKTFLRSSKKYRDHALLSLMVQLMPTSTGCIVLIHRGVVAGGAI